MTGPSASIESTSSSTRHGTPRVKRQIMEWFRQQGWRPFPFQKQTWGAMLEGKSGLLHATTGTGKTYAVWMGIL
ncbi:MAG TPA: hypothetical protein VNQ76_11915, partial [Planctomicrobium sp.]|nr:hypothetical protein [Planctomicrobium sp.]